MVDLPPQKRLKHSRRAIIRTVGGMGAIGIMGSSTAKETGSNAYSGVSYDTLTKKEAGEIHAQINSTKGGLEGSMQIAGHRILLETLYSNNQASRPSYQGTLQQKRFLENGKPLTVRITEFNGSYAGLVSRPTGEFGILGFNLAPESSGIGVSDLRRSRRPDNKWTRGPVSFEVPADGVPTSTGMHRIARLNKSENVPQSGGGQ